MFHSYTPYRKLSKSNSFRITKDGYRELDGVVHLILTLWITLLSLAKRNWVENAIYCWTNRLSLNKHILAVNEVIIALFFMYGHITVNFISKFIWQKIF